MSGINEKREPYVKPELTKIDNIKDLTTYDGGCTMCSIAGPPPPPPPPF